MAKRLIFHEDKCTGCGACTSACSLFKFGKISKKKGAIRIVRNEFEGYEHPHFCFQCSDMHCLEACHRDALFHDSSINAVVILREKCNGCGLCAINCPYGMIDIVDGTIIKCDLCNGTPKCIEFCSVGAIEFEEGKEETIKEKVLLTLERTKKYYHFTKEDLKRIHGRAMVHKSR